jgi:hypothetical protein
MSWEIAEKTDGTKVVRTNSIEDGKIVYKEIGPPSGVKDVYTWAMNTFGEPTVISSTGRLGDSGSTKSPKLDIEKN